MSKIHLLSKVLNIPAEEMLYKIKQERLGTFNPINPVKLKEGLSFEEVASIEARKSDFPGLIIETEASRDYIYGSIGSHLIGYLGKINPSQSKDPSFRDVPLNAFIGQGC